MVKYIQQVLSRDEIPHALRKLRKKLRQIDNLEQINNRLLTKEEEYKVASKQEIRDEVQNLSSRLNQDESGSTQLLEELLVNLSQEDVAAPIPANAEETAEKCCWQDLFSGTKELVVSTINKHNDIVYDVAADEEFIVTCSRDTMVKVWDAVTGLEVHSLRGHTSGVSVVLLLTHDEGIEVAKSLELMSKHRVAISAGHDCTVCIWSITTGELLKSAYAYNSVTCMALIPSSMRLLLGTDGGKIDMWDVFSLQSLNSILTYDAITQIQILNNLAYVANSEGIVSIMRILGDGLVCLYSSEGVASASPIHALQVQGDHIYYGDDGINIKMLNWQTGLVKKFLNHCTTYGSTNAMYLMMNNELIASNYDIDSGISSLNVFKVPENKYVCSLSDEDTGRILSALVTQNVENCLRVITVGTEFKVWDVIPSGHKLSFQADHQKRIKLFHDPKYEVAESLITDSEIDDCESDSGSCQTDDYGAGRFESTYFPEEIPPLEKSLFMRWCSIL